jgi:hypothetical protein
VLRQKVGIIIVIKKGSSSQAKQRERESESRRSWIITATIFGTTGNVFEILDIQKKYLTQMDIHWKSILQH